MKTMVLSGFDVVIDYDKVRLRVRDGKEVHKYSAGDISDLQIIYLSGLSGYISVRAMRFLSHMGVTIAMRYLNGKPAYDMIPQLPQRPPSIRLRQYKAFLDDKTRSTIANELVVKKNVLHNETLRFMGAPPLDPCLGESIFAKSYWKEFGIFAERYGYEYEGRSGKFGVLNREATNPINSVLNLSYGYVEARLLREIALAGLDHQISFLHEPTVSKLSLTYDLIELLRHKVDRYALTRIGDHSIKPNMFRVVNATHYLVKEPTGIVSDLDGIFKRDDYKESVDWLLQRI